LLEKTHSQNHEMYNEYTDVSVSEEPKIDPSMLRQSFEGFPQLSEFEVVRHYTQLSQKNFSIDAGMYPLGSCTMKYNPKINDLVASDDRWTQLHPYTPEHLSQGALSLMYLLQEALVAITKLRACSLHPAAGAHGELVGVKMIRAYHEKMNQKRDVILVPDSAHGTNPASAALSGFSVRELKSNAQGFIDLEEVRSKLDERVAGIMMTVPNTLGVFEQNIRDISSLMHDHGALVYCDGANLNALVGQVDFSKMGVDVMHINLHKTFSTPHGGGGPGAGPVVVSERLESFLPKPLVIKNADGSYGLEQSRESSVGRYRSFYGNFGMLLRALCYIYAFGCEKISMISEVAVLNANYIRSQLLEYYHLPYQTATLHEVVFNDKIQNKESGVTTLDLAKRLMDFGFHPPTMYFPLVVHGALMIEPTETEPKTQIDEFIAAMIEIAKESKESPEKVKSAPHNVGFSRLDETRAARKPILTWFEENSEK
ncbi:MAG: aminomethyl-transferring glycine dehydrogenase subunit GcvPB, partial [Bdellovibrionales bacterium]|nr:aminomethyl-transferring glycine dehydrogenase subunit GcvPB [Bdellovibrionales bacterium]